MQLTNNLTNQSTNQSIYLSFFLFAPSHPIDFNPAGPSLAPIRFCCPLLRLFFAAQPYIYWSTFDLQYGTGVALRLSLAQIKYNSGIGKWPTSNISGPSSMIVPSHSNFLQSSCFSSYLITDSTQPFLYRQQPRLTSYGITSFLKPFQIVSPVVPVLAVHMAFRLRHYQVGKSIWWSQSY